MEIIFRINYRAAWKQTVCITGTTVELGKGDETKAVKMTAVSESEWVATVEFSDKTTALQYSYLIVENETVVRCEWGLPHLIYTKPKRNIEIYDIWNEEPTQKYLHTSGFTDCFFEHRYQYKAPSYPHKAIAIQVVNPLVKRDESIILCGESPYLGEWDGAKGIQLVAIQKNIWQVVIDASNIHAPTEYKLAIYNRERGKITRWEDGRNRHLQPMTREEDIRIETTAFRSEWLEWKAAGVAIPVFALRTGDSCGIGEFSDLKKMVDWANKTNQRIIQVLPINDTTITYSWTDSYPYNAISTYALHPIYLGLKEFPLRDATLNKKYGKKAAELNALPDVDYDKVIALKKAYIRDLYTEQGCETLDSKEFKLFFKNNGEWLFSYACFTYLRDKYKTADYTQWEANKDYNRSRLEKLIKANKDVEHVVSEAYFTQYLLHKQLSGVKEYAHRKGVILKGDIPIGISRNSVEAWVEPHLFNLDTQTGAPPDDFSINGQNWGFPTYNWDEMAKDGYQWWKKRFKKMADYFDAYRIDHILGFFRIWEIPLSSVQGLLGHFNPALPLSKEEIASWGFNFDESNMDKPFINKPLLEKIFGSDIQLVIKDYLNSNDNRRYELKAKYNSQAKIKAVLGNKTDGKTIVIRNGLYALCNEVLFIRDKRQPDKYHPRITAQYSNAFASLSEENKEAFNRLYDNYFYQRHTEYWRNEAMKKLPTLVSSTEMLVCGEDLGMIPQSVPSVMRELQILSLEIQRMPKTYGVLFEDMNRIPYTSVCTTSTHDMAPIRAWWEENPGNAQIYYNEILHNEGTAPEECTPSVCEQIVAKHLYSPAMLAIIPLQDWLSIDSNIRREQAEEEQINIPAIANHYWKYRMHITIEKLMDAEDLNSRIAELVRNSGRM